MSGRHLAGLISTPAVYMTALTNKYVVKEKCSDWPQEVDATMLLGISTTAVSYFLCERMFDSMAEKSRFRYVFVLTSLQ